MSRIHNSAKNNYRSLITPLSLRTVFSGRKYKDYVYGKCTDELDKDKEHYLRCKDETETSYALLTHLQLHMSKYKKWRFTIHYVKPTAQMLFKSRLSIVTSLQMIFDWNCDVIFVNCSCTCKVAQRRSSLVNIDWSPPGIRVLACKKR